MKLKSLFLTSTLVSALLLHTQELKPISSTVQEEEKSESPAILETNSESSTVQEEKPAPQAWKLSGIGGLNFSQTSLTNWSAGGDNAVAGTAYLNASLIHQHGNWLWQNTLGLEYGLTNTGSKGTQKSSDKIELSTQLGYSTDKKWYYTGAADFKTQFYKGYNYPNKDKHISKFMAPGYLNLSLGVEYRPEGQWYSIYYSPAAAKLTFVQDDYLSSIGSFGVKPGDKFRAEMGSYLKAKAEKGIMENVKFITKVDFFTAYNSSFGNVDVDWDFLINMKVNKFLSASINTTLKYDNDTKFIDKDQPNDKHGARVQFKEVIGVGISYTF